MKMRPYVKILEHPFKGTLERLTIKRDLSRSLRFYNSFLKSVMCFFLLILHLDAPHLDASPDGKVFDLVEVLG